MLIDLTINQDKFDILKQELINQIYPKYSEKVTMEEFMGPFMETYFPWYIDQNKKIGVYEGDDLLTMLMFNETKDLNQSYYWFDFKHLSPSAYCVADNVDQILNFFKPDIDRTDTNCIITCEKIWQDKSNAGNGGGWRWGKWGPYIGNLNPQCEYLDDEDFGDDFQGYIYIAHIYRISENKYEKHIINCMNKYALEMKYLDKTIKIIDMPGETEQVMKRYRNRVGIVEFIDDMGGLHGTWGGLALIPDVDTFEVLDDN